MAHPLAFKPEPVDLHQELMRRVEMAPKQHAEALLGAWDLLQAAHDQGILDLAQGLIGGRDIIFGKIAEGMQEPESIVAVRNGISLLRVLAGMDPEVLQNLAKGMDRAVSDHKAETKPPSLWQLFRQMSSVEGRRALGFGTTLLTSLGGAIGKR